MNPSSLNSSSPASQPPHFSPLDLQQINLSQAETKKQDWKTKIDTFDYADFLRNNIFLPEDLALALGDSFIANTSLEGGYVVQNHTRWQRIATALQSQKTPFSQDLINRLPYFSQDMEDLVTSEKILDFFDRDALLAAINQGLEKRGEYVLSARVTGTKTNPAGHVFAIIFSKDPKDGSILAHILNKGDGAEKHLKVSYQGKEKISPQYYPIRLPENFLQTKKGLSVF